MNDKQEMNHAFARSRSNVRLGSINKVTFLGAVSLVFFFAVANFGWQYFQNAPDFEAAVERTYFQAWALLLAWVQWR